MKQENPMKIHEKRNYSINNLLFLLLTTSHLHVHIDLNSMIFLSLCIEATLFLFLFRKKCLILEDNAEWDFIIFPFIIGVSILKIKEE